MLEVLTYLQGSSGHFESMVLMEKTIPLGDLHVKSFQWYLGTLLIASVSGYPISWVFGSGIIFSGGPIVQFEGGLTTPSGAQFSLHSQKLP